jgi:hypothetical protein
MLKRIFSNLGKKGPESTAISGQLIIPTAFDVTLSRATPLPTNNIINPEKETTPIETKPIDFDITSKKGNPLSKRTDQDDIINPGK